MFTILYGSPIAKQCCRFVYSLLRRNFTSGKILCIRLAHPLLLYRILTLKSGFCRIGIEVIHTCQTLCALLFEILGRFCQNLDVKKKRPTFEMRTFFS